MHEKLVFVSSNLKEKKRSFRKMKRKRELKQEFDSRSRLLRMWLKADKGSAVHRSTSHVAFHKVSNEYAIRGSLSMFPPCERARARSLANRNSLLDKLVIRTQNTFSLVYVSI